MGTTAQKLSKILETKGNLATCINYAGGNITDETIFKDYPYKLKKAYIDILNNGVDDLYDALPKTTDEDTSSTLDTEEGKIKIGLKPNIYQAESILPIEYMPVEYLEGTGTQYIDTGYVGNNKTEIDIDFSIVTTQNVLQLLGNIETDKSITFNVGTSNTAQSRWGNAVRSSSFGLSKNVIYNANISEDGYLIDGTSVWSPTANTFTSTQNLYLFSAQGSSYNFYGRIYHCKIYDDGVLVNDFIPCYRKADNVAGLYDIVNNNFLTNSGTGTFVCGDNKTGPRVDYPLDIQVVKDYNIIKIANDDSEEQNYHVDLSSKNLLNFTFTEPVIKNGIVFAKNKDGSLTLNGTASTTFSQVFNITQQVLKGTYTIKHNVLGGTTSASSYLSIQKSPSGNITDRVYGGTTSSTFNIESDTTIVTASLYITSGTKFTNYTVGSQLELGSAPTDFRGYMPNPIEYCKVGNYQDEIKQSTGKNLFDKDSVVLKNGYYMNNSGSETESSGVGYTTNYYKVKPNTQYTLQGILETTDGFARIYYYDNSKTWISKTGGLSLSDFPYTFTTPNDCYYIQLQYEVNAIEINTIQLEENSSATEWEPYGIGEWYLKKNIQKLILDETQTYTTGQTQGGSGRGYRWYTGSNAYKNADATIITPIYCDKLPAGSMNTTYYRNESISYNNSSNGKICFYISAAKDLTTTTILDYMEDHPMTVYYIKAKPSYIHLSEADYPSLKQQLDNLYNNAKSYDNETIISQTNDDLPFVLNISALAKIE